MLSNVIVDVTIPRRLFVFGQSRAKVSAGFTNVRSLAVEAFYLVYCFLLSLSLTLGTVSSQDEFVDNDERRRVRSGSRTSSKAGKTNV